MRQLPIEQQVLLLVQIGLLLLLCGRMLFNGLHRIYPFFFGYLTLEMFQAWIPLLIPLEGHSYLYRDLYVVSQGLIVAFYALVVFELYSKVFQGFEAFANLASRYIRVALVLAIFIALLPVYLEKTPVTMSGYLFAFERTVMSILVVFTLLLTIFLVYYPLPLVRNVIVYLAGYAVSFLSVTIVSLIINVGYSLNRWLSSLQMAVDIVCLLFWVFALNLRGENKRLVVSHQGSPREREDVLAELAKINAALLRSRDKMGPAHEPLQ